MPHAKFIGQNFNISWEMLFLTLYKWELMQILTGYLQTVQQLNVAPSQATGFPSTLWQFVKLSTNQI